MFRAIMLSKDGERFEAAVRDLPDSALDENSADAGVELAVEFSTVNYKDALAITNRSPVVRRWPMVAGIDGAGTVVSSRDPQWRAGDRVVLNGWGIGENIWGCLAQRARAKGEWLIALPKAFSTRQAMAIGTAGYTAALSVAALERFGIAPAQGDVLVTGATGGVGSIAIALLSARGFRVVGSTGKGSERAYLSSLGAVDVIDRAELSAPGKPLQQERWAAVVDSVGSHTLVNACAQTRRAGAVAVCGLAQGMDLPGTVAPLILRGVALLGIDSVMATRARRIEAWNVLAASLDPERLARIVEREVPLAGAIDAARDLLAGRIRGRIVVNVNA
jgi:acrylyl-CoA reductase (NADPH)